MHTFTEMLRAVGPVLAAPMAGGPTTPELVAAATRGGFLAQLAGGYRTAANLRSQIQLTRNRIGHNVDAVYGVNLFVPNPVPITDAAYAEYAAKLGPVARSLGVAGLPARCDDDDAWEDKVADLLADPVPLVSFTFGVPSPHIIDAFHGVRTFTVQTVTSVAEARTAESAGVDALVVQGPEAGGHSAIFNPTQQQATRESLRDLVGAVRDAVQLPMIATGGITTCDSVTTLVQAGASAAMVGTLLLRAHEAGTSVAHRMALTDPKFTGTVMTSAFTGRPARALRNDFTTQYADAPLGYPALHHLTRPIRVAAADSGDADALHLWAGTGWQHTQARPVTEILNSLTP